MGMLTSRPWWRTPFGNVVVGASSWFLITVLLIVLGTIVYTVKAVFLTPVMMENKQRIEDESRRPALEYERDMQKLQREKQQKQ
ncbi:MAG TPA: hypothetical protein VGQ87_00265 [Patescibacteria group bacterium]|jgi:hypothetical protein|nr:hypothetical protein [Patescibacteria group bacterium]